MTLLGVWDLQIKAEMKQVLSLLVNAWLWCWDTNRGSRLVWIRSVGGLALFLGNPNTPPPPGLKQRESFVHFHLLLTGRSEPDGAFPDKPSNISPVYFQHYQAAIFLKKRVRKQDQLKKRHPCTEPKEPIKASIETHTHVHLSMLLCYLFIYRISKTPFSS